MPDPQPTPPPPHDPLGWSTFKSDFRSRMMAGLILFIPIWLSVTLVRFVFGLLRDASLWIVEWFLVSPGGEAWLTSWGVEADAVQEHGLDALPGGVQWALGALSIALTIVLLYLLGIVGTNIFGRRAIQMFEALLDHVPLVKTVYRGSKQMLDTFTGKTTKPFQRVVSIPFPTANIRSIAFVTGSSRDVATGEELLSVMLANPMTGFIFVVKKSQAVELDWTVEDALKMMMSGGALTPPTMPFDLAVGESSIAPGRKM